MGTSRGMERKEAEDKKLAFLYSLREIETHKVAGILGLNEEEVQRQYLDGQISDTTHLSAIKHSEKLSVENASVVATRFMIGPADSDTCMYVAKIERGDVWAEKVDTGKKVIDALREKTFGQDTVTMLISGVVAHSREMYIYQQSPDGESGRIGMLQVDNQDTEEIRQSIIDDEFIKGFRKNGELMGALTSVMNYISESYNDCVVTFRPSVEKIVQKSSMLLNRKDENGNNEMLFGSVTENRIPAYSAFHSKSKKMSFISPIRVDEGDHAGSYARKVFASILEDVMDIRPIPNRSEHSDNPMYQ